MLIMNDPKKIVENIVNSIILDKLEQKLFIEYCLFQVYKKKIIYKNKLHAYLFLLEYKKHTHLIYDFRFNI